MIAVLDTNVVVSGILSPEGHSWSIISAAIEGALEFVTCRELVSEYHLALGDDRVARRHGLPPDEIDEIVESLVSFSRVVTLPDPIPRVVSDIDDDKVVACAFAGNADWIVSGDNHLLKSGSFGRIQVIRPAEAVALLALNT